MRYHLLNAWPSKIDVAAVNAGAQQVPEQIVTFVTEDIERVS